MPDRIRIAWVTGGKLSYRHVYGETVDGTNGTLAVTAPTLTHIPTGYAVCRSADTERLHVVALELYAGLTTGEQKIFRAKSPRLVSQGITASTREKLRRLRDEGA